MEFHFVDITPIKRISLFKFNTKSRQQTESFIQCRKYDMKSIDNILTYMLQLKIKSKNSISLFVFFFTFIPQIVDIF